jgi:hypothetical protein
MRAKEFVTEAFDQPYPFKWEKGEESVDALAQLPDGSNLSIMFNQDIGQGGDDVILVEFYRNNSQEVTGEGDAQRIFSTVLSAIQQYIDEYKPQKLIFSAMKDLDPYANYGPNNPKPNPESRAKLYDRLVQRYAQSAGYSSFREEHDNIVRYQLTRLRPAVTEGQDNLSYIGNCTDDDVIEHIFGDATGFAQAVEEYGDEFVLDDLVVKYDPETDVHSFYYQQQDVAEGSNHQHTEIIKHRVGDWIVYLDNHSVIRAMTRNIGPRMMSNLVTMVDMIPDLEDKVPKGGAFWIQDIKTNSSFYFKRLDIPSEPLAVRCETGVQDIPRANKQTPVFQVNAYTGPETKQAIQGMKQAKLRSKFVGTNTLANTLATNIQKGRIGGDDAIRNPATQDSKRYDTAFKQAQRMDKEVDENFADGRNPQDKGDSKRHGINTKASVSSLRKTAKQGGRKGQLAHWLANMKSGRAKKK